MTDLDCDGTGWPWAAGSRKQQRHSRERKEKKSRKLPRLTVLRWGAGARYLGPLRLRQLGSWRRAKDTCLHWEIKVTPIEATEGRPVIGSVACLDFLARTVRIAHHARENDRERKLRPSTHMLYN